MNIHAVYRPFFQYFRKTRLASFTAQTSVTSATSVLDVGGTEGFWDAAPIIPCVTLLNTRKAEQGRFPQVIASACDLPFRDKCFDIVFSNSVIEHLGNWENQQRAAREMLRVGKRIWVQTPYRWFPVEPHLLTPGIQWLPRTWQRPFLPFTIWALITHPSAEYCDNLSRELRLLDVREMRALFPGCQILMERWAGLPKSLIASK